MGSSFPPGYVAPLSTVGSCYLKPAEDWWFEIGNSRYPRENYSDTPFDFTPGDAA